MNLLMICYSGWVYLYIVCGYYQTIMGLIKMSHVICFIVFEIKINLHLLLGLIRF